jgi:hypothetical protein
MTESIDTTPSTEASLSDWEAERAAQDRLHHELQPRNKGALFDALATAGVTLVVVAFDGYADSGQIENIEAKASDRVVELPTGEIEIATAAWGQATPDRSKVSIRDAIEQLTYDFLNDTHGGWEDNDGAYGDFTFDVAERTITLDYNERYTETQSSQHVF